MSFTCFAKIQNRVRYLLVTALAMVIAIMGINNANAREPWNTWVNQSPTNDVLIGKLWSVEISEFVSPIEMVNQLAKEKYILIGEVHDNADHHRLQAWLIDNISTMAKPTVVMEMIRSDKAKTLSDYMNKSDADAKGLGEILNWDKSGWPNWEIYQPIAEAIIKHGLTLLPGDASRTDIRNISKTGFNDLGEEQKNELALDKHLPRILLETLNKEIVTSHCNMLPNSMIEPMVKVQRYRDAVLARAMVDGSIDNQPVILIAGNGHVRKDRAVPWYIARQDQTSARIASILLLEVGDGDKFNELLISDPNGKPASDYIWFTPKVDREDQCEQLRKRFNK